MHASATGSAASINVEWDILSISVEDGVNVSMTIYEATFHERVRLVAINLLESPEEFGVDDAGAEILDWTIVIYRLDVSIFVLGAADS